jgi:hypothetical protein
MASQPDAWPAPYCQANGAVQRLHDVGAGHFVLASADAAARELGA